MKKLLGLLTLLLIMGCDDGDMTFETFNFDDATVQSCTTNNLIFKVNGSEALILELEETAFLNIPTNGTPRVYTINGSANRLIYRNYSGTVTTPTLCSSPPPSSPSVAEEWIAQSGGIVRILSNPTLNNEGQLTGYAHSISFENITFSRGEETIIISQSDFGTYNTTISYTFDFLDEEGTTPIASCPGSNRIYRVNGDEALIMQLNPLPFPSVPGQTSVNIGGTSGNVVNFWEYENVVTGSTICDLLPTPAVEKPWTATGGQLLITTTEAVTGGYDHIVSLVNVTFSYTIISGLDETFIIGADTPYPIGFYHTD